MTRQSRALVAKQSHGWCLKAAGHLRLGVLLSWWPGPVVCASGCGIGEAPVPKDKRYVR